MADLFRTQDTDAIHRTNVEGTRNLIAATKAQAPQARPIMASTNLVYGSGLTRPAREDDPTAADSPYPASKILAETDLKASSLNWSILRFGFGFVYGDKDGHLESAPALMANWKWHPAQTLDLVHHRDIAAAVELALTGALDGHTVNVVDESPTSIYEIAQIVSAPYEPSAEPLDDPWKGRADGALLRTLGFTATVPHRLPRTTRRPALKGRETAREADSLPAALSPLCGPHRGHPATERPAAGAASRTPRAAARRTGLPGSTWRHRADGLPRCRRRQSPVGHARPPTSGTAAQRLPPTLPVRTGVCDGSRTRRQ